MERLGSDQSQLASFGGGVISEEGAVLLSGESTGGSSLLFGPAALREIQANVANGDFAIPPLEALDTVDDTTNPLPYFTGVATGAAPTVTAAITASALTASGNVLTFTAAANAGVGSAYEIKRYVPISGGSNRASAYHPEVNVGTTTGGATDKTRVRITITATACDADLNALTVTATANGTASTITSKSLFTNWIVPDAKAAFILLSVKVDVPTTSPVAAVTMPVTEVRLARSEGAISFPALQNPSGDQWIIQNENLQLEIFPQTVGDPSLTMVSDGGGGTYSIALTANNANGTLQLTGNGWATLSGGITTVEGEFVDINSDTTVDISAPSGVTVSNALGVQGNINIGVSDTSTAGALVFKGGAGGSIRAFSATAGNDSIGVYNTSGSAFGFLVAENFYPGGQGSAFLTHDGNFDFNDSVDITGNITATGSATITGSVSGSTLSTSGNVVTNGAGLFHDTPTGVTLASGSTVGRTALWTLNAGTQYNLQRWTSTSTAALKKNIVDTTLSPEQVYNLALVDFEYDLDKFTELYPHINVEAKGTQRGVIWEQVAEVLPEAAVQGYGPGDPPTIDWEALYFGALVAIQDLNRRLEKLENGNG